MSENWKDYFSLFDVPKSRQPTPGTTFPLAIRYTGPPDLDSARRILKTLPKGQLLEQGGGALLVRGLPVETDEDLSVAVRAFEVGKEYKQAGGAAVRRSVGIELQTANDGPSTDPM